MKKNPLVAGLAQFGAQSIGLILAIAISVLLATRLGAGPESDAFLFARRIVTGLTDLLGQVLAFFFIPLLIGRLARSSLGFRHELRSMALWVGAAGATAFALVLVAAGPIAEIMLPEAASAKQEQAALYLWVFTASLPALLIALCFAAALNTVGGFGGPMLLRQLPRSAILVVLIVAATELARTAAAVYAATWYLVAAILGVWAFRALDRAAADGSLAERRETHAKGSSASLYGTAVLLIAVGGQMVLWAETYFAALLGTGQLTILEFTQRLGGLAGNTLSGALILPLFSLWLMNPSSRSLVSIMRISLTAFTLLALMQGFLLVNAGPLFELLYGRGAFTEEDRAAMLRLMQVLAFAPFGVLVMRMAFVWHLTTTRRFRLAEVAGVVLLDVSLRWWIMATFSATAGLTAIAAAMFVSPLAQAAVLIFLSVRRRDLEGEAIGGQLLLPFVAAVAVAALVAGHEAGRAAASILDFGAGSAAFTTASVSGVVGLCVTLATWKALGIPFRARRG